MLTFDTHIDISWPELTSEGLPAWEREENTPEAQTCFSLPQAREGGLSAACLVAYVPQGPLSAAGHEAAWKRVQAMLEVIHVLGAPGAPHARTVKKAADVHGAVGAGQVALVPVIENGYAVGEDPARLEALVRRFGVRYMTLTHNGHNLLADSAVVRSGPAESHGGLSALGREMIETMNRHGVLVDVSHAAKSTMMQAVAHSSVPVFASHSCVRSLCDHPRNLDDEQLDALKESGGVLQVTAMPPFLRRGGGGDLTDLVRHIRYAVDRLGIEHVGISSDFDGGGGVAGWQNVAQCRNVTQALKAAGFDASEIEALWGGNMMRLLALAERKAADA
ncbi:dipeptidase [Oecophyllibacter saccharovorans]|uniref:dipeptidase n=1 Tax=Oecophyllibacter saccharovorans TaxID=2558360 RepID=UPI001173CA03|nr:dipeptidase [Oecophyllibacter saccharovorans]TPW34608.1 membrane dipeptidase [Oecophyllibacter saccharovorans]